MGSEYVLSRVDGLPLRPSGAWAKEKLYYVERYMRIFSQGMKNLWGARVFVDLLAGPGRCIDDENGDEFDGSPLLAINCAEPFSRIVLIEQAPELCDALRQRAGRKACVIPGDCNNPDVIQKVRAEFTPKTLGLAFVDNLGLDVPLVTLAQLTEAVRIDLVITFQIGDLTRNLENVLDGWESEDRWTAFFGSANWLDVVNGGRARNESPSEIATRLMNFYGDRLGAIGYPHITHSHQFMRNSRNVALYRLLLASKHQRAVEFFQKIAQIEPGGQRRLF